MSEDRVKCYGLVHAVDRNIVLLELLSQPFFVGYSQQLIQAISIVFENQDALQRHTIQKLTTNYGIWYYRRDVYGQPFVHFLLTNTNYPMMSSVQALNEIQDLPQFKNRASAAMNLSQSQSQIKKLVGADLHRILRRYDEGGEPGDDALNQSERQLYETAQKMHQNLDLMQQQTADLKALQYRSNDINQLASDFDKDAARLRKQQEQSELKFKILMLVLLAFVILIVIVF